MKANEPKRGPGWKKGVPRGTKWGEPTVPKTHRMTPTAHDWIKQHKAFIETEARKWQL